MELFIVFDTKIKIKIAKILILISIIKLIKSLSLLELTKFHKKVLK